MGRDARGSEVGLQECSDLLEQSEVVSTVDLGSSIVHRVTHPVHGGLLLINTTCGRSAVFEA